MRLDTPGEGSEGHFHTAGYAIAAMGLLAGALFLSLYVFPIDLGFIERGAIGVIAVIFLTVGAMMTLVAEGNDR